MPNRFIDFLLPRESVDDFDDSTKSAFFLIMQSPSKASGSLPIILGLCIVKILFTHFVINDLWVLLLLSIPTAIIAISNFFAKKNPCIAEGGIIFSLTDFFFTAGILLIIIDIPNMIFNIFIYYFAYFILFVWTTILYRKQYKNFKDICILRLEKRKEKPKYDAILIGVVVTVLSRILLGVFSYSIIGSVGIFLICYFICPAIAELLVFARQYKPMMDKFKPTNVSEL